MSAGPGRLGPAAGATRDRSLNILEPRESHDDDDGDEESPPAPNRAVTTHTFCNNSHLRVSCAILLRRAPVSVSIDIRGRR